MSTSRRKIVISMLLIWIGGALGIALTRKGEEGDQLALKAVFCDVGQGDAILLNDGKHQVLIDGGPDASVLRCLRREMPNDDQQIETMILTHPDADHVVGLVAVLQTYQVQQVIVNNLPKDSVEFRHFYELVWEQREKNGTRVREISFAQKWCETKNICLQVLSDFEQILPEKIFSYNYDFYELSDMIKKYVQKSLNYNSESIVLNFNIGDKNLTLTGDVEKEKELAMVRQEVLTKVDVLKIAHHGSKTSSSEDFVAILRPEYSVISCGAKNSYGHPDKETLATLERYNSQILRTDERGWIKYVRFEDGHWEWKWEND